MVNFFNSWCSKTDRIVSRILTVVKKKFYLVGGCLRRAQFFALLFHMQVLGRISHRSEGDRGQHVRFWPKLSRELQEPRRRANSAKNSRSSGSAGVRRDIYLRFFFHQVSPKNDRRAAELGKQVAGANRHWPRPPPYAGAHSRSLAPSTVVSSESSWILHTTFNVVWRSSPRWLQICTLLLSVWNGLLCCLEQWTSQLQAKFAPNIELFNFCWSLADIEQCWIIFATISVSSLWPMILFDRCSYTSAKVIIQ